MKEELKNQIKELAIGISKSDFEDLSKTKNDLQILRDKIVLYEYLQKNIENLVDSKEDEIVGDDFEDDVDKIEEEINDDLLSFEDFEQEAEASLEEIDNEVVDNEMEEKVEEESKLEQIRSLEEKIDQAKLFEDTDKRSLNDQLRKGGALSIGLNDRILFVKKLFDNSAEDYNRVMSQISTYNSFQEVENFINDFVKPDYDWDSHPEVSEKFINVLQMKFN